MTADPLVGTTIGQYEVVARLGGGGMGIVYAARDTKLGRRVALKFLPPQWSHDEAATQRFMREAQAASATDHPNICTIHDIGTTPDGRLFIVMALYEGQTLKQRLETGPVPMEEAIEIAAQVAEGLAKAHTQGVVHRDIKPGNLMLTEDGVRILDFGLAKFADSRLQLTTEGSTLGTVAYMSPEQTRGDDADARSDIWAVGVVLYEMLIGTVPFKGGYPEAIAHAIRSEPPESIRARGVDIPEALEQIVFRSLHKTPAVRFQTARDLARALRLLQGRTLPMDLRTEPVPVAAPRIALKGRRAPSTRVIAAAALVVGVLVGMPLWVLAPASRVGMVVVPVVNETGYAELDPYRLALTQQLIASLSESRIVRVVPFDRLVQIVRQFRDAGDISSREAVQALVALTDAAVIVSPVLMYENGAWRARIDVTARDTSARREYLAEPITSALPKEASRQLIGQLATLAEAHVIEGGPRRVYLAELLRASAGMTSRPVPGMRSLDAARAFADGLDAYEQQEYAAALEAFTAAANDDSTNPVPAAWRARVARLMGQLRLSREAAAEAERRGVANGGDTSRLFVEAVVAETRDDDMTAATRYRQLAERWPDEPSWAMELGAFFDRQERYADAVTSYTAALALDEHLARPHLELCRLYGPVRRNDPPNARTHGQLALERYQALRSIAGEAQARWCLVDVLNVGDAQARDQATTNAELAREVLGEGYPYGRARADHYLATTAATQGRFGDAARAWEAALAGTRASGNVTLEATVLTNLSVAYERLGDITRAIDYRQQGYKLFEATGNQQRAAQNQANGAFLMIEYGVDPARGLAEVQNALAVVRAQNDRNFEVFCLRILGSALRHAGRRAEAERELNRAIAIAAEGNLEEDLADARIELARLRFDDADYAGARALLLEVVPQAAGLDRLEALLDLARTELRLGLFDVASQTLANAETELMTRTDTRLRPVVDLVRGEIAYESGRPADARAAFGRAASAWNGDWPHDAAVEGRAYLGLLNQDPAAILMSLERARRIGRSSTATRAQLFLARLDVAAGRADSALKLLRALAGGANPPGRELRAQVEYWTGRALSLGGDAEGARASSDRARALVREILQSLPEPDRSRFSSRVDIRAIG